MSTNSKALLKFANVQMAAESLFGFLAGGRNDGKLPGVVDTTPDLQIPELTLGNTRASKFTATQAAEFSQLWEVVEHKSNTKTGFSGTLFKAKQGAPAELLAKHGVTANELVLSFRSTEFADDAARDNQATNALEFNAKG